MELIKLFCLSLAVVFNNHRTQAASQGLQLTDSNIEAANQLPIKDNRVPPEKDENRPKPPQGEQEEVAKVKPWPKGEILVFVPTGMFTMKENEYIIRAFCEIEKVSCIRFSLLKEEPKDKKAFSYLYFNKDPKKCNSYVGKLTGNQTVNLGPLVKPGGFGCFIGWGNVCHELMHALGFSHEQTRNDRDTYVTVKESLANDVNYGKEGPPRGNYAGNNGYDLGSITHYPVNDNMKLKAAYQNRKDVGQRQMLSYTDIAKLKAFTGCASITPKRKPFCI